MENVAIKKFRGSVEDLQYRINIVAVDSENNLVKYFGDIEKLAFTRSSVKFIQAISVLETSAFEKFNLTLEELALCTGSHNGEEAHVLTAKSMLDKAGLGVGDLQCGYHYSINKKIEHEMIKSGTVLNELYSNCSGKHAGMLVSCAALNEDYSDYTNPNHFIQKFSRENLAKLSGLEVEDIKIAIDGCGVPVFALPLKDYAYAVANFMATKEYKPIVDAMRTYPFMVAGTDRFCTDLITHFGERLIGKFGAEGYYAIGLIKEKIGITFKIECGSTIPLEIAVLETLLQMNIITKDELKLMDKYYNPKVVNHRGETVGNYSACFKLKN